MTGRRHAFDTRCIRQNAAELRHLESLPVVDLPWPRNLFSVNFMVFVFRNPQDKPQDLCICGKDHHKLYPRTRRSEYGHGFNVTYYCSDACKTNAVRAESEDVNGE